MQTPGVTRHEKKIRASHKENQTNLNAWKIFCKSAKKYYTGSHKKMRLERRLGDLGHFSKNKRSFNYNQYAKQFFDSF